MTKTPPHRRGIAFQLGAPLEARDNLKNWYPANIEKIDYENEKVLIHYRQWSHRYDEWFDWNSPYLRPVERIQLRRQGLQEHQSSPSFHVNQKVLASWSDCRYYVAKILSCDKDDSYTVRFFDGVVKTIKGIKIKPFRKENSQNKVGPQRRRGGPPGKEPKENGAPQSNGTDRDGGSDSEEDNVRAEGMEPVTPQNGHMSESAMQERTNGPETQDEQPADGDVRTTEMERGEREEEEEEEEEVNGRGEEEEEEEVGGVLQNGSHHSDADGQEKEDMKDSRSAKRKKDQDAEPGSIPVLRKRRTSAGKTSVSKRRRTNSSTDRHTQLSATSSSDSAPASSDQNHAHPQPAQPPHTDTPKPPTQTGPAPDFTTLLQRQIHLPTTNKYSREPLYRVIKNQPPPILSIELDHNPFKCQVPGCSKSFRKASLLHYHMKYYHSESDLSPPRSGHTRGADRHDTPCRRRTHSASLDTPCPLSDGRPGYTPSPPTANGGHRQRSSSHCERSKENQHANRSLHDDRDWVAMETEREKRRVKRRRDFYTTSKRRRKTSKSDSHSSEIGGGFNSFPCNLNLSLKLPFSHKHCFSTSHLSPQELDDGEDSGSDWSSDSPAWSEEDESEVGLELNMPILEQEVEMVDHDRARVRCVCEVQEENDFMIQCDKCLCWQHGTCMGLYEDSVPDSYSCYICRDSLSQRQSQRYWYDKDWLSSGHMYGLSFLEENYSHQNSTKIATTHQLLGDVHRVFEVLNSLQLKMSILQTQAHPDLKLWRQPWRPMDSIRRKTPSDSGVATPSPPSPQEVEPMGQVKSESPPPMPPCSIQTSYISSDHCYQKPRTYYPALERRLVVETRGGSELEHSLRSTEDLLELAEHRYGAPAEHEPRRRARELECRMKLLEAVEREKSCEVKEEEPDPETCDPKPDPDLLLHQQWQLNLLEHIEAVQDEVSHRMDLIERELDVLESWLDYTGELEPPDPLARLPQLKQHIRQLLSDLQTVQQIALCSMST